MTNDKKIYENRIKNSESFLKESQEESKHLRFSKDKIEGQLKIVQEELDIIKKSYEEMATKKQTEIELLTRELN